MQAGSINNFLNSELRSERPETPRKIFLRVSEVDIDVEDRPVLQAEAIGADWLMENMQRIGSDLTEMHSAPISVISDAKSRVRLADHLNFPAFQIDREFDEYSDWYVATISDDSSGLPVSQFLNLYGEPQQRYVSGIQKVDRSLAAMIEKSVSLQSLPDADPSDIRDAVMGSLYGNQVQGVAVYDVGQGNCNALLDGRDHPVLYFDLGGGVLANAHTFPTNFTTFCFHSHKAAVLSHWDWDHWSSGPKQPASLNLSWIVPRQSIGSVHAAFAASILTSGGQLLIWPSSLPQLSIGELTIVKCTGRGQSRNSTGLAAEVVNPSTGTDAILLTGDARYSAIPTTKGGKMYHSVIAPHHGADMRSTFVAQSSGGASGRCTYSFGMNNSFGHRTNAAETTHVAAGWPHAATSILETINRDPISQLGHIGIYWNKPPSISSFCNGGIYQTN